MTGVQTCALPICDAIVGYDQTPQKITLYPGNVQTLNFSASAIHVLIAQVINEDNTPLARGRISNALEYGGTDQDGWFQVELDHREPLIIQRLDGSMCQVEMPDYKIEDGLAVLDALMCRTIPVTL